MRKSIFAFVVLAFVVGVLVTRADAATSEVHIVNGAPNPQELTIQDGDTVTFVNDDDVPHAIYAQGQQRGATIEPHTRSQTFGPFQTGGQGGRSEYQVDEGGAAGVIIITGTSTTTSSSTTTTTTAPTTSTTTTIITTTSTSTTTTTTSTSTTTTTTTRPPASSSSNSEGGQDTSWPWLAPIGALLALIGVANFMRVVLRPKSRRRR